MGRAGEGPRVATGAPRRGVLRAPRSSLSPPPPPPGGRGVWPLFLSEGRAKVCAQQRAGRGRNTGRSRLQHLLAPQRRVPGRGPAAPPRRPGTGPAGLQHLCLPPCPPACRRRFAWGAVAQRSAAPTLCPISASATPAVM